MGLEGYNCLMGIFVYLTCLVTICIWTVFSIVPISKLEEADIPRNYTSAPHPAPLHPPCGDGNWSAGSAFFTLTALTFGYVAHPRGCLIYSQAGRMWRLSPLFALVETGILWCRLLNTLLSRSQLPFKVICHAIMAVRVGSSWSRHEIIALLEERDGGSVTDENDSYVEDSRPLIRSEGGGHPPNHLTTFDASRSQTWPTPTPAEVAMLSPNTRPDGRVQEPNNLNRSLRGGGPNPDDSHQSLIIDIQLDTVSGFEHGPSYRVFIWIPMLFQALKLLVVSGHGAILTQIYGWIFFFSWASIEMLLVAIAARPLNHAERAQAHKLCESWMGTMNPMSSWNWSMFKYDLSLTQEASWAGQITLWTVGFYNFLLIFCYPLTFKWVIDNLEKSNDRFVLTLLLMVFFSIWVGFVFYITVYPWPLMVLLWSVRLIWALLGQVPRLGVKFRDPAFGRGLRSYLGPNSELAEWVWFDFSSPLLPGYVALFNFMILLSYHSGMGNIQVFECWNTQKPSFYDWLG